MHVHVVMSEICRAVALCPCPQDALAIAFLCSVTAGLSVYRGVYLGLSVCCFT